jgi:hypothetical protein
MRYCLATMVNSAYGTYAYTWQSNWHSSIRCCRRRFGQDYSSADTMGDPSINLKDLDGGPDNYDLVYDIGDVEGLKTDFSVAEFEELFQYNHRDSNVGVHSLVSQIYISGAREFN